MIICYGFLICYCISYYATFLTGLHSTVLPVHSQTQWKPFQESLEYIYCTTGSQLAKWQARLTNVYNLYRFFTSGVVVAALSCLVRPTAAIFWIPVFILRFYWSNSNEKLIYAMKLVAVGYDIQLATLGVYYISAMKHRCYALCWSLVVDRIYYGKVLTLY